MKKLRLLGLSFVLLFFALAQTPPAHAACPSRCTSNSQCQQCSGIPYAFCVGGRCAF